MKVAIIGGGAAGLMAAATLRELAPETEVVLLERNDGLGKKVIISGGGRCNVTTGLRDVRQLLTRYPRGGKFLTSAMYGFPPEAAYAWFEEHGVPLKMEDDLRCFPQSDDGHDIVRAFERVFAASRVQVLLKADVVGITRTARKTFLIECKTGEPIEADRVVLTTGGQAYRHTGSTGDGYAFAIALGHTITPLAPGLNSFWTKEHWPAEVSGVSFEKATITARRGKGTSFTGPFLFTHRGVSGPAVFALSSLVAFERYDHAVPLEIAIDLFPDVSADALLEDYTAAAAENPSKLFRNMLAMLVPKSLAEACVADASLPGDRRAVEVAKKDVQRAIAWLKGIPLHVVQRGAGDEFVTAGGVALAEIDPSTMESKICPGLYFAGEIMDVDGFTGGFNLQASWAAGRLAGKSIAEEAGATIAS